MITALRDADLDDKLAVYRNLGLRLTYDPQTLTVRAEIELAAHRWDSGCVRGRTRPDNQPGTQLFGILTLT
jgi:site-specific DNA recombinase